VIDNRFIDDLPNGYVSCLPISERLARSWTSYPELLTFSDQFETKRRVAIDLILRAQIHLACVEASEHGTATVSFGTSDSFDDSQLRAEAH
jgi:hypothetical protein